MISGLFQKGNHNRLLILSILLFLVSYFYERLIKGDFLINPLPNFSPINLARTALIIVSSLLLIAYVRQHRSPPLSPPDSSSHWLFKIAQWLGWIIALACFAVFLINPQLFSDATTEDYVVEVLSAMGLLLGSILMVIVLVLAVLSRKQMKQMGIVLGVSAFLILALFVSGMEEISWFQRVFHFATPEVLSANSQQEANLHNLASNTFEEIYYFGSFFVLILIPFIAHQSNLLTRIPGIKLFLPNLTVLFSCALFSAYNYNLWNRTSIQFAFFTTLWILAYYCYRAFQEKSLLSAGRYLPSLVLLLFIITQVVFIFLGDRFFKSWNVTEYRELLMPYGYLIWTIEVLRRTWLVFQQHRAVNTSPVNLTKATTN